MADLVMKSLLPSEAYGASDGEDVEALSDDGSPLATSAKPSWGSTVRPLNRDDDSDSDDSPMRAPNARSQRTAAMGTSNGSPSRPSLKARLNGNPKDECWAE